jgi:transposase InsO family protein
VGRRQHQCAGATRGGERLKRIDENGPDALLQLREPVNKFQDCVRYIVQRLKTLSPSMGKLKIAETLCRAELHLGVTTVGRILKEDLRPGPGSAAPCTGVVTAKRPNHVWHVDLTAVATSMGFWAPWLPFALPQRWPFCWWVAIVIDHYSRRAMGFAIFRNNPTSVSIQSFLESAIVNASIAPKYIICDKVQQFWCDAFKAWCDSQGITSRFGAVGQHGSIALVERFILTLKNECTRIILLPLLREVFHRELGFFEVWFNQHRLHSALDGKTPYEMYHEILPACQRPRVEPRSRWPRSAPCSSPHARVTGHCGARIHPDVRYHLGRKHLPIVELRRAA